MRRVALCRDARLVSSERASVVSKREGVHRVKGYSIVVLTGTDALRLDTSRASLQRVTRISRYTSRFDRTDLLTYGTVSLHTAISSSKCNTKRTKAPTPGG